MVVEEYPTRRSVRPGEEVPLCCAGRGTATVEVARLGADREVVWRRDGVAFDEQPLSDEPAQHGCGWAPTLTVPVGTTVTWVNNDDIPHAVVADDKTFRSKVLDTDQRFAFTFTRPGEYGYFCSLHPHMTGKIVVKAG